MSPKRFCERLHLRDRARSPVRVGSGACVVGRHEGVDRADRGSGVPSPVVALRRVHVPHCVAVHVLLHDRAVVTTQERSHGHGLVMPLSPSMTAGMASITPLAVSIFSMTSLQNSSPPRVCPRLPP